MNILDAMHDENLFAPFFGDLETWRNWEIALACLYGLPLSEEMGDVVERATGRTSDTMAGGGYSTALFLTGRRSGKSRIAAAIGAYESVLAGHKLSPGETGMVAVLAPTRKQGGIVKNYLRGIFDSTPLLQREVVKEDREGFLLRNGVRIQVLAGDFKSVRGFTLLACIVDEISFFGLEEESKVKSDTELIRALLPSLATTGGKLIAISSPYARRGWTWSTHKKNHSNAKAATLVWNTSSREMNPTLPQSVIDNAMQEDSASARSEYLGEFRDDVVQFLPRSLIESYVVENRRELVPKEHVLYRAFVDMSGGRSDDSVLAISHKNDRGVIVIDKIACFKAPHNPTQVIMAMAIILNRYRVDCVFGDNYAGEFVSAGFRSHRIRFVKSDISKSAIYLEMLPRLCSGEIELLDDETLINQLAALERRTRSGGRDTVDHPQGGRDDVANAVAGAVYISSKKIRRIGAI